MDEFAEPIGFEGTMIAFLVKEYYDDDIDRFAHQTGYTKRQVCKWIYGGRKPQKATMRWLLSSTIAPEFRIATEFTPVNFAKESDIRPALAKALGNHQKNSGVYAFYDSMCNVLYIGKASSGFIGEMYQQLRAELGVAFPKAISGAPKKRWQAVHYVSAYEIPNVEHLDYPKQVEALVLRLSKPIGNKILGKLQRSVPPVEKG